MRFSLTPRTTEFYVLFGKAGENALEVARLVERRFREHPNSGVTQERVKAVETADSCLGRVVETVQRLGGVLLITADHGNAETMLEPDGVSPHTAHTTNPVPLILTGGAVSLREGGELSDLAPTVLALLGLEPPPEMSGKSLLDVQ